MDCCIQRETRHGPPLGGAGRSLGGSGAGSQVNLIIPFTFPEVHDEASVTVTVHRTLRVPDDGRTYPLPPSLGTFPARRVPGAESRYPAQIPVLQVPMYQSEALWLGFLESRQGNYPMRIRILSGQTDAVSGERVTLGRDEVPPDAFPSEPQGFVVVPEQPWLDGFRVDEARVRQFVAEPLGLGRSAEEQLDPDAAPAGGIWIGVEPLNAEIWEAERQRARALSESTMAEYKSMDLASSMGLAPGGGIIQQIFTTHRAESEWSGEVQWLRVELMSSLAWMHATGRRPPHPPPTSREYTAAGLPWFTYWHAELEALDGPSPFTALQSLGEWDPSAATAVDVPEGQVKDLSPAKMPNAIVP